MSPVLFLSFVLIQIDVSFSSPIWYSFYNTYRSAYIFSFLNQVNVPNSDNDLLPDLDPDNNYFSAIFQNIQPSQTCNYVSVESFNRICHDEPNYYTFTDYYTITEQEQGVEGPPNLVR